jgi:hypothetical protein
MSTYASSPETFDALLNLVARNVTREVFVSLLLPLKLCDEKGNLIETFHCAMAYIKRNSPVLLADLVLYDVCPKDCVLFRGDLATEDQCPLCGADRYDGEGNAVRIFPYVPLIPRIRRFFASENWSRIFEASYQQSRRQPDGFFEDVFDGSVFRRISAEVGHSKYKIPFFFGVDGITMDGCKRNLSVEPIALVNCWVPRHDRTKSEYVLLGGLVPPNSKNVRIFLEPLLEEATFEFSVFDALTREFHDCQVILIFGVFDYMALGKFTCGNFKPSYLACHECHFRGRCNAHPCTASYMGHFVYLAQEEKELRERSVEVLLPPDKLGSSSSSTDGPPRKRSKRFTMAAGKMAEDFPGNVHNPRHPRRLNYQKSIPFINLYLPYWHPRDCLGYCGLHAWLNKVLFYFLSLSLSLSMHVHLLIADVHMLDTLVSQLAS